MPAGPQPAPRRTVFVPFAQHPALGKRPVDRNRWGALPRGLPLVGNALQIRNERQWLQFDGWAREHGDMFELNVLGKRSIVLSSTVAAYELLDVKGSIYSDRPAAVMAGELAGWDKGLGYARGPHQTRFREFRRLMQQFMGPRGAFSPEIVSAQEEAIRKLLLELLSGPDNFAEIIRESTGALILRLTYGYRVQRKNDPLVKVVEEAMAGFAVASEPGTFWVDSFRLLKFVPDWFPFAGFKRQAAHMYDARQRMYDMPFHLVKTDMANGAAPSSFTSDYLDDKQKLGEPVTPRDEELIKAAAASLYSGGAETTPASLTTFILAMTLHPQVQERAQAEVDAVLGVPSDGSGMLPRLPILSDRSKMPYVDALVREVYRWNPTVPLGLPHRLTKDDVYRGHYIPAGTIVWANIWSMLNDPVVFLDPASFRPERFLEEKPTPEGGWTPRSLILAEDPIKIAFGFGRRVCPGIHLADNSVFLTIASMLAVMHFDKARDANDHVIEPVVEFDGFITHPAPFNCSMKARRLGVEELLEGDSVS